MSDWSIVVRPAARRILESLVGGPLSLTALAERTASAKGSLVPHLRGLVELGLITRREVRTETGREVFFGLRDGSLHVEVHAEAGAIVSWATSGEQQDQFPYVNQVEDERLRAEVHRALTEISAALEHDWTRQVCVILFGSVARGEATWKSDIDLLILSSSDWHAEERKVVESAIDQVQSELEHAVRARFSTTGSFRQGRSSVEREAAEDGMIVLDTGGDKRIWGRMTRYKRISI